MVVLGQKWLCSLKSSIIRSNWLYSGKSGRIREKGCIREKVVVFGQKWLYSGKLVVLD